MRRALPPLAALVLALGFAGAVAAAPGSSMTVWRPAGSVKLDVCLPKKCANCRRILGDTHHKCVAICSGCR